MKTILRQDIPKDFTYYRTGSKVFYDYYKKSTKLFIHRISHGYEFLKAGKVFGLFWSCIVDKVDNEVSIEILKDNGLKHGVIFWGPLKRIDIPKGWIRLPSWIAKTFHRSSRSGFSILDRPDYWIKWSSKARGHRNKILKLKLENILEIRKIDDPKIYIDIYRNTHVKDPYKDYLLRFAEKSFIHSLDNLRIYIAYINNEALAGAVFIDEGVTSEYFTSFYSGKGRPYHLGIALMDAWFSDSIRLGIKYCDLDHLRDNGESKEYQGYTKFKESIIDYDVFFRDMWIRFF